MKMSLACRRFIVQLQAGMNLMHVRLVGALWVGLFLGTVTTAAASVQQPVTTPEQQFGHEIGADYELVNYTELY
jgi:hypothetical protein